MFTGIIESFGTVEEISPRGSGITVRLSSQIAQELSIDQILSHDGVCLTVETIGEGFYTVTAVLETLRKTNLGQWQPGSRINLERCMQMNGRLDGHIVQGHADATAVCINRTELEGSWEFRFRFPESFTNLVIEKGSVSINGISLTIFNVTKNEFSVAIIPYTFTHTNMNMVQIGSTVNIEFDVIGKYIQRMANNTIQ